MKTIHWCLLLGGLLLPGFSQAGCGGHGVRLQVLGSGGPELGDKRASSGYVIWVDGKARVLVDLGPGSLLRFEQAGARLNDLDLVLLTHLHVDHSSDLPALVKAGYFTGRDRDLPIYGPSGNALVPSMTEFVQGLFGPRGIYRYLGAYLTGGEDYRLLPHNVDVEGQQQVVVKNARYTISAVPVQHGPIPALAWRVEVAGHSIVFSGDLSNRSQTLVGLASGAELLVAHHAIPEGAGKVARTLHITPSVIGEFAERAGVKRLVLSHRMLRTIGHEDETVRLIHRRYHGRLEFAEDLQCFTPG